MNSDHRTTSRFSHNELKRMLDTIITMVEKNKYSCPEGCCKCCGPVAMSKTEATELGLDRMFTLSKGQHEDTCEFVDEATGKCSVYNKRPFICRFFNCTWAGVFKCNETPANGLLSPAESEQAIGAYFQFIELEGHISEFMSATDKTFDSMKRREERNGWGSRFFGIKNER